jgi:hypothetical protein
MAESSGSLNQAERRMPAGVATWSTLLNEPESFLELDASTDKLGDVLADVC